MAMRWAKQHLLDPEFCQADGCRQGRWAGDAEDDEFRRPGVYGALASYLMPWIVRDFMTQGAFFFFELVQLKLSRFQVTQAVRLGRGASPGRVS